MKGSTLPDIQVPAGNACITEKLGIFERVEKAGFGQAWKDIETGLVWSETIHKGIRPPRVGGWLEYTQPEAVKYCEKLGGALPSQEQVIVAVSHGLVEADMLGVMNSYWTSTLDHAASRGAYVFLANDEYVIGPVNSDDAYTYATLCVFDAKSRR